MYQSMDSTNDGLMNAYTWKIDLTNKGILNHSQLIGTLENVVRENPKTTFIACHLANCEYDLEILGTLFRKYSNNGNGNFTAAEGAIPDIIQSGSGVVAVDYDHDGDLDLFLGGRMVPGEYPMPADSYLLRNDSDKSSCRFTDVTKETIPGLLKLGMVTTALWTDVDNDSWADLMIVGEFMPITCFKNIAGKSFTLMGEKSFAHTSGWWNSISSGDFDSDGDTDYVAGNLGLNTRYKGNEKEPVCIYANDYDKNGSIDPVMTYYLQGAKHIVHARDELISQISAMRMRFKHYKEYSEATFDESFLKSELQSAYVVCSEMFNTSYIENKGHGNFSIKHLTLEAQFSPIYGMVVEDFNKDGNLDVLMAGNLYSAEVNTGHYDASLGLFLQGDGSGNFFPVKTKDSGFIADCDAKGMAKLVTADGKSILLVGNNSDPLKAYRVSHANKNYKPERDDSYALITLKNGKIFKHEFNYGSTYLSQSSRYFNCPAGATKIKIFNSKSVSREIVI